MTGLVKALIFRAIESALEVVLSEMIKVDIKLIGLLMGISVYCLKGSLGLFDR